jgi:hypothetical protein
MDVESITKIATASVAGVGALVGLFQFLTSRRSQNYQTYKTELELLSQSIVGAEGDPGFKQFLVNVRKEKLSFVAFGMPIPNSELERLITYYGKGKATTQEIAKAWRYRNPTKKELSFELHGFLKFQLIMVRLYAIACFFCAMVSIAILPWSKGLRDTLFLVAAAAVFFFILIITARANEGLFTATRLAKREKDRSDAADSA